MESKEGHEFHGEPVLGKLMAGDVEGNLAAARIEAANEMFESRDFYELCQQYRWAKDAPQVDVIAAFEALKDFGRAAIAKATGSAA